MINRIIMVVFGTSKKTPLRAGCKEGVIVKRLTAYMCAVLSLLLILAPDLNAGKMYEFKIGDWTGKAYRDDITERFTHCSVSVSYTNGMTLALGIIRNYNLVLVLAKPGWGLGRDHIYLVHLNVDEKLLGQFPGTSGSGVALRITLGRDKRIYETLRGGHVLAVKAGQESFSFKMNGTAKALNRVKQCVDAELAFAPGTATPFGKRTIYSQ
jgi:hypothetical protein